MHRFMDKHMQIIFKGSCVICQKEVTIKIKKPELLDLYRGKAIQVALVSNTTNEQEFLISGICSDCFDNLE